MKVFFFCIALLFSSAALAKEEPVTLNIPDGVLCGTLNRPATPSETALLIIAGSGPTDRNGNNPMGFYANSYAQLSAFFEKQGFASLRYDKRGIGASKYPTEKMEKVVLQDFIDDAAQWVKYLKNIGFKRVILVGHSEGALIAFAVAAEHSDVDALISLCGAGLPIDVILKKQISEQTQQLGLTLTLQIYSIIDSLKQGGQPEIPNTLATIFPRSALPFLVSAMQYDPCALIERVHQPILLIGGSHDLQVPSENIRALKSAQPTAQEVIVEGMTHPLKNSDSTDRIVQFTSVYQNGDLPLSTGLETALADFLRNY
ncbi:MAG: alpha/beta fold hydrolase [Alistipes sp.]